MAVTITSTSKVASTTWRIKWTSDYTPGANEQTLFTVRKNGRPFKTTSLTTILVPVSAGDSPVIEITDPSESPTVTGENSQAKLTWNAVTGTDHYRVEQLISAVWTPVSNVPEVGLPTYEYWTARLEDSTATQFRVIPVFTVGQEGSAIAGTVFFVRHPDPPPMTSTYAFATKKATFVPQ